MIDSIDRVDLRRWVGKGSAFPFFSIGGFFEDEAAERILAAFPSYQDALKVGRSFDAVNERGKVQVTDSSKFAEPIAEMNSALASPEFLGP